MDYVASTIKSRSPWILLDEQLVVFERILATVESGHFGRRKQVVIVRGGPGTGKSVLAINLMAELMREGRNAHYATGSKADAGAALGVAGFAGLARRAPAGVPVVAIGGISAANAGPLVHAGAAGVAVIAAVLGASDPERAARQLAAALA